MATSPTNKPGIALKIPMGVRFTLFFDRHKAWSIALLATLGIALLILLVIGNQQARDLFNNPSVSGVFGAFVGAIGAGGFSFYILRRQFEAASAIAKKNNIYIPLYNDLAKKYTDLKDRRSILRFNSYDHFFAQEFKLNEMKNDNRYLEIPQYIASIFSSLLEQHENHCKQVNIAIQSINNELQRVTKEQLNAASLGINDGSFILSRGLNDKNHFDKEILKHFIHKDDLNSLIEDVNKNRYNHDSRERFQPRKVEVDEADLASVKNEVYTSLPNLPEVQSMIAQFDDFMSYLGKVIELLKTVIIKISQKYESRNGLF